MGINYRLGALHWIRIKILYFYCIWRLNRRISLQKVI